MQPGLLNRRALIQAAVALPFLAGSSVNAEGLFDGGGQIGWGEAQKAGVAWGGGFSNPLTQQGNDFAAEVVNGQGNPVLISFSKPKSWKVSTNTGIAIQDYTTSDSGYVLVAPALDLDAQYLLDKVFDIRGRYGTFGKIDNVKISKQRTETEGQQQYLYLDFKFTSLSPGGREIDRNACIKATLVDGDAVMLVASSNSNRWNKVKDTIAVSINSFSVTPTPKTSLKGGQVDSGIGNKEALGVAGYDLLRYDSPVWTN